MNDRQRIRVLVRWLSQRLLLRLRKNNMKKNHGRHQDCRFQAKTAPVKMVEYRPGDADGYLLLFGTMSVNASMILGVLAHA